MNAVNCDPVADTLIVDLARNTIGEIADPGLAGFSERHSCSLRLDSVLQPVADAASKIAASRNRNIVFVSGTGVPNGAILSAAGKALRSGSKAFVYWPSENAVEVIDRHRLASFKRHRLVSIAFSQLVKFGKVRNLKRTVASKVHREIAIRRHLLALRRVSMRYTSLQTRYKSQLSREPSLRLREAATRLLGASALANAHMPTTNNRIKGTGAYVRVDYWANIKTGGSYGHTCFLAKSLMGITEHVRCLMTNRFELLDTLEVPQESLPNHYSFSNGASLILAGETLAGPLGAALDRLRPVYVYERSVLGSAATARWCLINNVPYIVEYNGSELDMARSFGRPYDNDEKLEALENFAFKVATVINVISKPVADTLVARGVPRQKILVNPNSVDPQTYGPLAAGQRSAERNKLGLGDGDIVVGFCGTFGGWHGIDVLSGAMPEICRRNPKVKFLLIGDGNEKHLVRDTIKTHRIEHQVVDLGLVPQLEGARAMACCDILVAPHSAMTIGKGEFFGSPTKLFEYMAVGAAVVASDLAQLGQVMRPSFSVAEIQTSPTVADQRGVLVRPGSIEDLVESVDSLTHLPDVRAALARNARVAVTNNYTWDIHVENIWRHMAGLRPKGFAEDCAAKSLG